jgi:hypothetical protein
VRGPLVDVVTGPELDQLAQVHDPDLVGHVLDHRQVVGDDHVGQPVRRLQPLHQVQHLRPDGHIQRRDRLIGHDQARVQGQRPRQPDPLPLPAGELVRVPLDRVAGQADLAQQLEHPLLLLLGTAEPLNKQRLPDDRADPHPGIKRGVRVLEHQLEVPAHLPQLIAAHGGDVLAVEQDRPRVRLFQADDHLADGGLAAAGLADQAQGLPGRNRQ